MYSFSRTSDPQISKPTRRTNAMYVLSPVGMQSAPFHEIICSSDLGGSRGCADIYFLSSQDVLSSHILNIQV